MSRYPTISTLILFVLLFGALILNRYLILDSKSILIIAGLVSLAYYMIVNFILMSSMTYFGGYDVIVRESVCKLQIMDSTGKLAKYEKKKIIIANKGKLDKYIEKGMWVGGSKKNLILHGEPHVNFKEIYHSKEKNVFDLLITPDMPLKKGEQLQLNMSWDIIDSFTNDSEYFTTNFGHPLNKYSLEITFPKERPVKKALLNLSSGEDRTIVTDAAISVSPDKRKIIFDVSYVQPGMKSKIYWEW